MLLLVVWLAATRAAAAVTLPYNYGFENETPNNDYQYNISGWTVPIYNEYTEVSSACAHGGNNSFKFDYDDNTPQYLISPELPATVYGIVLSFYYRTAGYTEKFQVGYSKTTANISAFTWYDEIASAATNWPQYEAVFPANTKYIAVKHNGSYLLFLDDFSITASTTPPTPSNLAAADVMMNTATISWVEMGTATSWQVQYSTNSSFNNATTVNVSNNPTLALTGLTAGTAYYVRVKSTDSNWSQTFSFTTMAQHTMQTNVAYIDANGNTAHTPNGVNVMVLDGSETSLVGGWYMVNSNITFNQTLTFSGDAHLILADDKEMKVGKGNNPINANGITSKDGTTCSLTIHSQTIGEHAGKLSVRGKGDNDIYMSGNLAVYGARLSADGHENNSQGTPQRGINAGQSVIIAQHADVYIYAFSDAISSKGSVTITDSKVSAIVTGDNLSNSYCIYGANGINITGRSEVAVHTESITTGIFSPNAINILGGKVSANKIYTHGDLTLGWTNLDDYIYCGLYSAGGWINIAEGKALVDALGNVFSGNNMFTNRRDTLMANQYLVPSTTVDITMNAYGTMTYASAISLDFDHYTSTTGGAMLVPYYAESYSKQKHHLIMNRAGKVPAGTGLMLKGTPGATFSVRTLSYTGTVDNNLLVGLTEATEVAQQQTINSTDYLTFILATGNHGVNWYKLDEDKYTLKANSAYLRLPADDAPTAARQLTVIFSDEATGMSGISGKSGKSGMCGDWYDLSGRRLSSEPTKKGIYIYKGKKVKK